ncbi:MAG: flagellar biosynthesis protein FlhF [Gammaproteobacteria bacterium]|nr:flagellar biosynthesis protein FlhF [Gammaproteobacteria bacterium]
MKVKRTVAPDMRTAIRKVREEQGPDAVILGNRKVAEGVEILSAVEMDEDALANIEEDTEIQVQGMAGTPERRQSRQRSERLEPQRRPLRARPQQEFVDELPEDDHYEEAPTYERPRAIAAAQPTHDDEYAPLLRHPSQRVAAAQAPMQASEPARRQAPNARSVPSEQRPMVAAHYGNAAVDHYAQPQLGQASFDHAFAQGVRDLAAQWQRQDMHAVNPPQAARPSSPTTGSALYDIASDRESAWEQRPAKPAIMSQSMQSDFDAKEFLRSQKMIEQMRAEMQSMRLMMQNQMSAMTVNQLTANNPLRLSLLTRLFDFGIGSGLARRLVDEIHEKDNLDKAWRQALGLLASRIPIANADILENGGVIAMVGPTGVGKTTTIAKLAAKFAMAHGSHEVALISTDTYRVGAHEQLINYARILNVPVKLASNQVELSRALASVMDRKLVLIDTAGASQRDLRLAEQFQALNNTSAVIKTYLTISATTQLQVVDEIIRAFSDFDLAGCVLTKLDEAYGVGAALTAMIQHQLPVAYLGTGQRVPEDLQTARAHRLVGRAFEGKNMPSSTPESADSVAARFAETDANALY